MSSAVAQKFVNANMLVMPMFKMSSKHILLIMKHTYIHTLQIYIYTYVHACIHKLHIDIYTYMHTSVAQKTKSLKRSRGTLPICSNYEEKNLCQKSVQLANV